MTKISKLFFELKNIRILILNNNQLERIENLDELKMLERLEMRGNQIKKIENLNTNKNLRLLSLSCNQLKEIIDEQFPNLEFLEQLGLFGNFLGSNTNEEENLVILKKICLIFQYKLPKMNSIYLGGNYITNIKDWKIILNSYCPNLEFIDEN